MMVMIFTMQNATVVKIEVQLWEVAFPLPLLISAMLSIGITGWSLNQFFVFRESQNEL